MTFSKSLYISLAVHIALFGSALAFAHFGGVLLPQGVKYVSVALVGANELQEVGRRSAPQKGAERVVQPVVQPDVNKALDARDPQQPEGDGSKGLDLAVIAADAAYAQGGGTGSVSSEEWRLIRGALERAKSYPRLARERGIEGVVRLRFKLRSSGEVDRVEVVKSSGYDILDSASVRTVYRAGPMPYVNGWVEVPISYVLK